MCSCRDARVCTCRTAIYHVTLRGNHRQAIFFRDSDRATSGVDRRRVARVGVGPASCLLLDDQPCSLARAGVRRAAGKADSPHCRQVRAHLQAAMKTTGHLFERRHHAVLVDSDRYLLTLVRYIHMNPVRAKLVARPGDYPWTSHHEYAGTRGNPWVTTSLALGMLSTNASAGKVQVSGTDRYRRRLALGVRPAPAPSGKLARSSAMIRSLR